LTKRDYYETLGVKKILLLRKLKRLIESLPLNITPIEIHLIAVLKINLKRSMNAYQVLSNQEKKARYDQFGSAEGMGGFDFQGGGVEDFGDFGNIFDSFFGTRNRRGERGTRSQRGANLRYNLEISFEDAAFGKEN